VTDPSDPFLPPELRLGDDDVVEAVEVVEGDQGFDDDPDGDDAAAEHDEGDEHDDGSDEAGFADEVVDVEPVPTAPERVSGFDGIGTRRESRERALALLYEAEQKGLTPPASIIDQLPVPPEAYAGVLVVGVSDHLAEVDALISRFSVGWKIERMPAIDRALLRLGCFELGWTDVPVGACISEAVELAKRYSTDDSHTFVNGLLGRVATETRPPG
jgi:N utilization substance protein B